MTPQSDHDFHHRIDLFEPGDKTALICVDVPEMQRLVVENLSELKYKLHTGLFVEDILLKLQTHVYDVVVFTEHFNATDTKSNPIGTAVLDIPPHQRRRQVVVMLGSSVHTDSDMDAWLHSVDLTVNLADLPNLKHVLRRAVQRTTNFNLTYTEALTEAGVV
jgi:hypothetical protein